MNFLQGQEKSGYILLDIRAVLGIWRQWSCIGFLFNMFNLKGCQK